MNILDVSIKTMIGQLPYIINQNNKEIQDQFDNIYNSTENILIKSIDTTKDTTDDSSHYVKSFNGTFTNLQTDYIIINNQDSKNNIISGCDHNSLSNRYLNDKGENIEDNAIGDLKNYMHNGYSIGVFKSSIGSLESKKLLTSLQECIDDIYSEINNLKGSSISSNNSQGIYGKSLYSSNESLVEPTSFTFDKSVLFSSKVQLKRMKLPEYQINDLLNGSLYTYYDYNNVIVINDEYTASINGKPGQYVKICFNDLQKKAFYRIVLSRKDKKFLRVSKDELVRLSLVCIGNDDIFGSVWEVDNYSVRHADDLVIEKKN